MSGYTPTTDEVRNNAALGIALCAVASRSGDEGFVAGAKDVDWPVPGLRDAAKNSFDRWLAEVERHAAEKGWDEGEAAGGVNAGDGLAALLGGVEPPEPRSNPYRRNEGENDGS